MCTAGYHLDYACVAVSQEGNVSQIFLLKLMAWSYKGFLINVDPVPPQCGLVIKVMCRWCYKVFLLKLKVLQVLKCSHSTSGVSTAVYLRCFGAVHLPGSTPSQLPPTLLRHGSLSSTAFLLPPWIWLPCHASPCFLAPTWACSRKKALLLITLKK